jgi:hypothetical protein
MSTIVVTTAIVVAIAASLLAPPAILLLLAQVGGWKALAAQFPGVDPAPGAERGTWGSIVLRGWCSYNNCIIWASDDERLHLRLPRVLSWVILPSPFRGRRSSSSPWTREHRTSRSVPRASGSSCGEPLSGGNWKFARR